MYCVAHLVKRRRLLVFSSLLLFALHQCVHLIIRRKTSDTVVVVKQPTASSSATSYTDSRQPYVPRALNSSSSTSTPAGCVPAFARHNTTTTNAKSKTREKKTKRKQCKRTAQDAEWLRIESDATVVFNYAHLREHSLDKDLSCSYATIEWDRDDFNYKRGSYTPIRNGSKLDYSNDHEFFHVRCTTTELFGAFLLWSSKSPNAEFNTVHARIFRAEENHPENQEKPAPISVFMLGMDSVSTSDWLSLLPKSSAFLFGDTLNATLLSMYNIVGDGTPAALVPLLTGKHEHQLPITLRSAEPTAAFVDDAYPFVWRNFSNELNYSTMFTEDWPSIGTFQYRMKGMRRAPTSHYMRPLHLFLESAAGRDIFSPQIAKSACSFDDGGNARRRTIFELHTDYAMSFMEKNVHEKGFFGLMYLNRYSHDSTDELSVNHVDERMLAFLTRFAAHQAINENTLLVLFADHGARFSAKRETMRGLLDERTPFFAMRLPPAFQRSFPHQHATFMRNADKLVTPMDVHKTLVDLVRLQQNKTSEKNVNEQAFLAETRSLFTDEISGDRTCTEAGIDMHWCSCLRRTELELDEHLKQAALKFVDYLNADVLAAHTTQCQKLTLDALVSVHLLDVMLTTRNATETKSGLLGEPAVTKSYRVFAFKVRTKPNEAVYEFNGSVEVEYAQEASINTPDQFAARLQLNKQSISRINRYGSQADCISKQFPDLRKYCYCK